MTVDYETFDVQEKLNAVMTWGCFAGCCVNVDRGIEY